MTTEEQVLKAVESISRSLEPVLYKDLRRAPALADLTKARIEEALESLVERGSLYAVTYITPRRFGRNSRAHAAWSLRTQHKTEVSKASRWTGIGPKSVC